MNRVGTIFVLLFLLMTSVCRAQFYTVGEDPASIRWNKLATDNFKVIYPRGLDSLAREYALMLESHREDVGRSIGFSPNQFYRRPMPVVLHPFNTVSNGSVAWTPRTANLFTTQDYDGANALPWIKDLAIHESRHIAQMQMGRGRKIFWPFRILTGQLIDGAMAGLYPGSSMLEGDAVVAETALTNSGRGRSASFLEYMMMSFDNGDFRNKFKWKYGSIRNYTPDYYKYGYLMVAGMRYICDDALVSKEYFDKLFSQKLIPFPINTKNRLNKDLTGQRLKRTFLDIEIAFLDKWRENASVRSPFMEGSPISRTPRRFTEYEKLCAGKDDILYSVRSGLNSSPVLVQTCSDGESVLCHFSDRTSALRYSPSDDRLYWCENVPDERWPMEYYSDIRYLDLNKGGQHSLTRGKRYFNPSLCPDGQSIAVSEYFTDGRTAITLIDHNDATVLKTFPAPDSLQIMETAWMDGELYATAISDCGYGIYSCREGYSVVLAPEPVIINRLNSYDGKLFFICDLNGSNELYSFEPASGRLIQLTSSRYGVTEGTFSSNGDTLFYSSLTPDGRLLSCIPTSELIFRQADFHRPYQNPIAAKLSAQEDSLETDSFDEKAINISDPEPYRKLGHLIRFHSWAPLFMKMDEIRSLSMDISNIPAGLGATAFFQNDLGTAYGSVGYHFPDCGTLKFTYSGLYPVIEATVDFNSRDAYQYRTYKNVLDGQHSLGLSVLDEPSISGTVSVYVPFNFSNGGWKRGLIPQVKYSFSNDCLNTGIVNFFYVSSFPGISKRMVSYTPGNFRFVHRLSASIRAYSTLSVSTAEIYPRLGIGTELLYSARPGLAELFTTNLAGYVYGYVPGILRGHGIKITALVQKRFSPDVPFKESYASVLPRGFNSSADYVTGNYNLGTAVTFNYALPLAPVEWHLREFAYLRNFELYLHSDCTWLRGEPTLPDGNLASFGCELAARFSSLLGIHFSSKLGITYSYNTGNLFETIEKGASIERHHFGLTFSTNL